MSDRPELFILGELRHCLAELLNINALEVVGVQTEELHQVSVKRGPLLEAMLGEYLEKVICVDEVDGLLLDLRLHHLLVDGFSEELIDGLSLLHQVLG